MTADLIIPASFRAMPRWWHEGQAWLDDLPALIARCLAEWHLTLDGSSRHGSNALVVPALRGEERLALRITPLDDRFTADVAALTFWNGRGTVQLVDVAPDLGAMLLERLDADYSLAHLPLAEAMPIAGRLLGRLAVPAPDDVPSTADLVRGRLAELPAAWARLGRPFERALLDLVMSQAIPLTSTTSTLAVNGDMHGDQVLRGEREPWLVVDPLLLRGDREYDLARLLWTRLDEMEDDAEIRHWFDVVVQAADLDPDRAWRWVLFRTVDYWLWGLDHGLTEDPVRCARLVSAILSKR